MLGAQLGRPQTKCLCLSVDVRACGILKLVKTVLEPKWQSGSGQLCAMNDFTNWLSMFCEV